MTWREKLIAFGDDDRLSGIVIAVPEPVADAAGVLLFNAGIVHRIGAHRLNVKLARRLAARGRPSLRFDLSGLGDSVQAPPGRGLEAQTLADIRAGADALAAAAGVRRFVVIGMCSGADNGYRAALADERIKGLVLLDPYSYANRRAQIGRAASKALDLDRWKRAIARAPAPAGRREAAAETERVEDSRPYPPREAFGADLQRLAARGVAILILYTAYVREHLTRPAHFLETFSEFDFAGRLEVGVDQGVDHTYTELGAQRALIERIARWLEVRGL